MARSSSVRQFLTGGQERPKLTAHYRRPIMNMGQLHERWTMEEIKARYAPDWVIIAEPQIDDR